MTQIKLRTILPFLLAIGVSSGAAACGQDNPEPTDDKDTIPPDEDSITEPGSGGTDGQGGDGNDGNDDDDDDDDDLGELPPDRTACAAEPDGNDAKVGDCWDLSDCNGAAAEQFLNQCRGGASCIGFFDDEARIEGFTGTLPPLE